MFCCIFGVRGKKIVNFTPPPPPESQGKILNKCWSKKCKIDVFLWKSSLRIHGYGLIDWIVFYAVSPIFHLSHIRAARSWISQTKYTDDDMRRVVESSYTYDHQGVLRTYFNPNHNQISKKKQIEKKIPTTSMSVLIFTLCNRVRVYTWIITYCNHLARGRVHASIVQVDVYKRILTAFKSRHYVLHLVTSEKKNLFWDALG